MTHKFLCWLQWCNDSAVLRHTFLQRRGFLQTDDVSAHDISQASACVEGWHPWSRGLPFNIQIQCHVICMAVFCCLFFGHCNKLSFNFLIQWLICNESYCCLVLVSCFVSCNLDVTSRSKTVPLELFRPHPLPPSCLWLICFGLCSCDVYSQCNTSPTLPAILRSL